MFEQEIKAVKKILQFIGKSGSVYKFHIYPWPHTFTVNIGAIFLFTRFLHNNFHVPIYLGITENLKRHLVTRRRLASINKNKPTHICISIEEDKSKRQLAQEDLSEIAETHLDFQTR